MVECKAIATTGMRITVKGLEVWRKDHILPTLHVGYFKQNKISELWTSLLCSVWGKNKQTSETQKLLTRLQTQMKIWEELLTGSESIKT